MKTHEERIMELELLVKMMAEEMKKLTEQVEELENGIVWDVKAPLPGSAYIPHKPGQTLPFNY